MSTRFPSFSETSRSRRVDPLSVVLLLGMAAWLLVLFHWLGNTSDVPAFGPSVFRWMVIRWGDATFTVGEYSHGWLIPFVSLAALWWKRNEIRTAPRQTLWAAVGWVVLGLALHWIGARVQQPRLSLAAFVLVIWAIPCFLYGPVIGRLLAFPCFYLLFCIPMNFFDSFSFQLRILATAVSTAVLQGLGIEVIRSGSAIRAVNNAFALEVADPCSGIRSLLAMTALTAAFAYFSQRMLWKRVVLFASAVPLAVAGNIVRVLSIGIVAHFLGQDKALHYYHDYSGYSVFIVAVLLMLAIEKALNRAGRPREPGAKDARQ
jgi:exosortase